MKRFLPLFLIVAMLVTMIPSVAFAETESTENTEPTAPTEPVIVDTDKEFKPINVVGRDSGLPTDVPAKMGYTIMRASQNILDCIKSVEGFVEHEYRDNNTYSIGYGTVISYYAPDIENYVYNEERKAADVKKHMEEGLSEKDAWGIVNNYAYQYKITPEEGEMFLLRGLEEFEEAINDFCRGNGIQLNQHQFDALLDMAYNRGLSWLYDSGRLIRQWLLNPTDEMGFVQALGSQYGSRVYSSSADTYQLNYAHAYRRVREAVLFLYGEYSLPNKDVKGLEKTQVPQVHNSDLPYYTFLFYQDTSKKVNLEEGTDPGEYWHDVAIFYRKGEAYGSILTTDWQGKPLTYQDEYNNSYVLKHWLFTGTTTVVTAETSADKWAYAKLIWELGQPPETTPPETNSPETNPPETNPPETNPSETTPETKPLFPFADVPQGNYFRDAVEYVYKQGIMEGVSDTMFDIYGTMTRGMLVTVLYRMAGSPATQATTSFVDVPQDAYYAKAVAWAQANDLVNGVSEDRFDPDDEMTQQEFVTLLYRYCIYYCDLTNIKPSSLDAFDDADSIVYYAQIPFAWCVSAGIITLEDGKSLAPGEDAIRGYVAMMLMRLDQL